MFVVIDHRQHDDIMVLHLYTIIYFYNNMHSLNNMKYNIFESKQSVIKGYVHHMWQLINNERWFYK